MTRVPICRGQRPTATAGGRTVRLLAAFFAALTYAALALPCGAGGQDLRKPRHIGFLGNSTEALEAPLVGAFRDGLRERGYVEGTDIRVEYRWAEGDYARFSALIADLLARKVEIIVTAGTPSSLAVRKATRTVPLVMVAVGDPVGSGLVESLARPGGNATGLTSITPELEGKRLELLREVIPGLAHVAVLWNPANAYQIADEKRVREAAHALGIAAMTLPVRGVAELDGAFATIRTEPTDAVVVLADRLFLHNRKRIVDFVAANRLATMNAYRELAEAGGLMSFGPNYALMHRQAAGCVDRILKGANPAELPVEQPAQFEFVLNLKAAAALGVRIPQTILLRADVVIE
jgi:putative ABC transport system substrate-binding protein